MSFKAHDELSALSSIHLPIHLSNPKDINYKFENYFYRGLQPLDCKNNSGFSLAVLTQFGDIFMNDFFWDNNRDMNSSNGKGEQRDRTCSSGIGSSNLPIDPLVTQYMTDLNDFLFGVMSEKKTNETNIGSVCSDCERKKQR